ncbi:MAG: hypothetical protein GWP91_09035 [Rhodobacterales bacterium]|nr:hypothetical protein [Rhodobacterales bacterium]
MTWSKHLFPHGPLTEVIPGIWQVTGSLRPAGDGLPRNMVVWKLPDGGVCIHNGVVLDDKTQAELEALGTPTVLIVPNGFHRSDAAVYKARYPNLTVVAPRAAIKAVAKVVPVDQACEEALPAYSIDVLTPDGLKPSELVYKVKTATGHVLLVTDMLFNLDHMPGVIDWILRHITTSTGHFGVTRLGRWLMLKNGVELAAWIHKRADEPGLQGVGVGHGAVVVDDVAQQLHSAADRI